MQVRVRPRSSSGLTRRRPAGVVVTVLGLAAALVGTTVLGSGGAAAAPRPSVEQVQRTVDRLNAEAEVAAERYNDTSENLRSVRVRLAAAQVRLKQRRAEVKRARQQLGRLAAETYKRGDLSTLDLMLSDDPRDALAQAGYLPSLTERQSGATQRLRQGELLMLQAQGEIQAQERKAARSEQLMKLTKAQVEQKLTQAQLQLAALKASQRAALQARYAAAAAVPGNASCADFVAATEGRARAVVDFACGQLGDPYVWAADGPGSWDCSGLSMAAWAAAGVSLPHSSRMQAGYGTPVAFSDLRAGDLVFFHSPISHVGIVVAPGLMIHAPHTGDVVRIARIYTTPSAAVRL